jgi:sigma-B regulation protein RsbU (phosphoserine phosphatase)
MVDVSAARRFVGGALRAAWRPWHGKTMTLWLVIGVWKPWLAVVPASYFAVRLGRVVTRRLLYSVRAKLVAFYLFAALLPIVLVAVILFFVGFVVLGQTSARVVETRFEKQTEWAEQRRLVAERVYWRARARSAPVAAAAQAALDSAWDHAPQAALAWARSGDKMLARRGEPQARDWTVPRWLGERAFAGITTADSTELDLRMRLRLHDGDAALEIGGRLPLDSALLNHGLDGSHDELHGGVGHRGRSLIESERVADSLLVRAGILALIEGEGPAPVSPGAGAPAAADGGDARAPLSLGERARAGAGLQPSVDSLLRGIPGLEGVRLRSRYPVGTWGYMANPVDWHTGRTDGIGPTITIRYTVEGAARALLATGFGVGLGDNTLIVLFLIAIAVPILLQIVATLQGITYARAISRSVAAIDRGVRAVRRGDFGHRIAPRERDQLGSLALAVDDMTERMQGLLEERATHEVFEREIAIARDVQARLFPAEPPTGPFLEAAGVCIPARVVSGDSYDFIELGPGLDAVISDVSGKGMSAALLMASLHSALRNFYLGRGRGDTPDPAAIVTRLNGHLHQYVEASRFVTLFLARYQGDGRLLYCNAGHNPAALVRDGRVEWLSDGGLMLGPFPDQRYETAVAAVRPGDVLCLYTDGVTEAEAPSGEQFGEDRLASVLRGAGARTARGIMTAVLDSVRTWRSGREPGDDVTLVVLKITA